MPPAASVSRLWSRRDDPFASGWHSEARGFRWSANTTR